MAVVKGREHHSTKHNRPGHETILRSTAGSLGASGISALLAARQTVTEAGHTFCLRGAQGIVRRVFLLTGLGDLLDNEPSEGPGPL